MPSLNNGRSNPGTFITENKRYLYAFNGFKEEAKNVNDQISSTIERLDLQNEEKGWELIVNNEINVNAGSFVMYRLTKLTRQIRIWQQDEAKMNKKSDIIDLDLLEGAGLEDKVLVLGGWQPYRDMQQVKIFDVFENKMTKLEDNPLKNYMESEYIKRFYIPIPEEEVKLQEISEQADNLDEAMKSNAAANTNLKFGYGAKHMFLKSPDKFTK